MNPRSFSRNLCDLFPRIVLVVCACGLAMPRLQAGKPPNMLNNAAWVALDRNGITLLASDGVASQTLLKSGRLPRFAPAYSPDGRWIAYIQRENNVNHIYRIRSDGGSNQRIAAFASQDPRMPVQWDGLQWVPGEVDRILYTSEDTNHYTLSTVSGQLTLIPGIGLSPALGPDLDPATAGYQGAVAHGVYNEDDPDPTSKIDIAISRIADTPAGLTIDLATTELLEIPGGQTVPAWSNDGLSVAFLDQGGLAWGQLLRTVPVLLDAQGIVILNWAIATLEVRPAGIYDRPTWSPDDEWIAYIGQVGAASGGGKLLDLFRVRSDGSAAPINVTNSHVDAINTSGRALMPHWNPGWRNDLDTVD